MAVNAVSSSVDIAVSGLRAQSRRMNVIAENLANAHTTRTTGGGAYRRKEVVLDTAGDDPTGVRIETIRTDNETPLKRVRMPGHPDADGDGFVTLPNVSIPTEMMNLVVASRAYQANAAVLKRYQQSVDTALELLR
ncbi:MAG: flagellar basal body rod protein FlgC [Phycisphaerae bacterium]|nr:flagellar basal body rod protein FlgC [Phycisphaerae bacterium]